MVNHVSRYFRSCASKYSQTVIWQVIPYAIKLSMWHEKKNEHAWFKFEKVIYPSMQGKHERLCIDSDQVKNILFVDKIQKELVALVVLSITSTLRCTIVLCSTVFINSKRK